MTLFHTIFSSPAGEIIVSGTEKGVTYIGFSKKSKTASTNIPKPLAECQKQLQEYFEGKRSKFDIKTQTAGTVFQKKVWDAMKKIPYGKTLTYGDIAKKIGSPKASRAVGGACNKNPLGIIVPCHRVVGGNARLTGYAGGINKKKWLLTHETKHSS